MGTQKRVKTIEDELKIKQPAVLRELFRIPCFFMDPSKLQTMNHLFVHRFSMPYFYSVDKHTAQVFPPVCNMTKLGLSADKHLSNNADYKVLSSLPTFNLDDVLDVSYSTTHGRGQPECLSTFLLRAEFEE